MASTDADMAIAASDAASSHGIRSYYGSKLEELEAIIREKTNNLSRLSAQRNALNAKGTRFRRAAAMRS
jgi:26S proteasome regulatory subunit T6